MKEWLASLAPRGYRVFVQHPPTHSTDPQIVLKYLARYVSGGPISNRRLVSWENGQVTFMAHSEEDALPGQAKEKVAVTISEVEFVRRWSLHILTNMRAVRNSLLASLSGCGFVWFYSGGIASLNQRLMALTTSWSPCWN